jgi:hypothetical protein
MKKSNLKYYTESFKLEIYMQSHIYGRLHTYVLKLQAYVQLEAKRNELYIQKNLSILHTYLHIPVCLHAWEKREKKNMH